jgi:hypothetical protein
VKIAPSILEYMHRAMRTDGWSACPNDRSRLERFAVRTAAHECGHAVAVVRVARPSAVQCVAIDSNAQHGTWGGCCFRLDSRSFNSDANAAYACAVASYAGVVAESYSPMVNSNLAKVKETVTRATNGAALADCFPYLVHELEALAHFTGNAYHSGFIRGLWDCTRDVLACDWPTHESMTRKLLARGNLTRAQVERLARSGKE